VTRKIYDFSPEQLQNLLAIVWLHRGQTDRFLDLVARYLGQTLREAEACFDSVAQDGRAINPIPDFQTALADLRKLMQPFLDTAADGTHADVAGQLEEAYKTFGTDAGAFRVTIEAEAVRWGKQARDNAGLNGVTKGLLPLAETSRDLIKQADLLYKLACRMIDICEGELAAKDSELWVSRDINKARKAADEARLVAVDQLKGVRYFHKQALWLSERFPEAVLRDVEGLVKLVGKAELENNDWSLTPGRYVGVAREEEDDGFDFEEALRDIHIELEGLNAEAVELAAKIKKNFEELGV
jgi:type I restriction enzyme M protein